MANETWLQKKLRDAAGRVGYETERWIIGINEQIVEQMSEQGVTRTALAERLNVDKAYVTRLLKGRQNVTIKTLTSVASVLGCRFAVPTLSRVEQRQQPIGTVVKFDRPVTSILITPADAFRPIGEQRTTEVIRREKTQEADADASAAAA